MIRTFGGVTGLTNQPQGLDVGLGGGSNIKSVQSGSGTMAVNNDYLINVPISAVDLTKSIAIVTFRVTSGTATNGLYILTKAEITSPTNLSIERGNSASVSTSFEWQVIEFTNIKSLQSGVVTLSAISTPISITQVTPNKSLLFFSHTGGGALEAVFLAGNINSNGIQITLSQNAASSKTVKWYVVEFP